LSFIDLANSKKTDLEIIKSGLKSESPPISGVNEFIPTAKTKSTYSSRLPGKKLRVIEYKNWLQKELHKVSNADDEDEIELES